MDDNKDIKLLLIGNKTDIPNKIDIIKDINPDIIVRYSKCESWELTKTDFTSIWLMDIAEEKLRKDYLKIPKECRVNLYKSRKLFFVENSLNTSLYSLLCFSKLKDIDVVSFVKTIPIEKYFPNFDIMTHRPSNFIWMLIFCLEKVKYNKLYITACDIDDRSHLKDNKFHKDVYKEEEILLQNLIKQNKITLI